MTRLPPKEGAKPTPCIQHLECANKTHHLHLKEEAKLTTPLVLGGS